MDETLRDQDPLTHEIIGAAIDVHRHLGPGLLESTYETCLGYELDLRGLKVETQKPIEVYYKDVIVSCGYRADMIVEGKVILELKAVQELTPIHDAQLLSYLKLANCKTGLLINFNVNKLTDGLRRRRL